MHSSWVCAAKATPVGFEPTRGNPIGLAGRRLSRSAKVSSGKGQGLKYVSRSGALQCSRRIVEHVHRLARIGVAALSTERVSLCAAPGCAQRRRHLWDLSPRGETPSA